MKQTLSAKMRHYLIDINKSIRAFCLDVKMSPTTFRRCIDLGDRIDYDIARSIVKETKGHITLADLGYEDIKG